MANWLNAINEWIGQKRSSKRLVFAAHISYQKRFNCQVLTIKQVLYFAVMSASTDYSYASHDYAGYGHLVSSVKS